MGNSKDLQTICFPLHTRNSYDNINTITCYRRINLYQYQGYILYNFKNESIRFLIKKFIGTTYIVIFITDSTMWQHCNLLPVWILNIINVELNLFLLCNIMNSIRMSDSVQLKITFKTWRIFIDLSILKSSHSFNDT